MDAVTGDVASLETRRRECRQRRLRATGGGKPSAPENQEVIDEQASAGVPVASIFADVCFSLRTEMYYIPKLHVTSITQAIIIHVSSANET